MFLRRRIRELYPIPISVMMRYGRDAKRGNAERLGVKHFFVKNRLSEESLRIHVWADPYELYSTGQSQTEVGG